MAERLTIKKPAPARRTSMKPRLSVRAVPCSFRDACFPSGFFSKRNSTGYSRLAETLTPLRNFSTSMAFFAYIAATTSKPLLTSRSGRDA